jgi:general nucleoside transport system permease protein
VTGASLPLPPLRRAVLGAWPVVASFVVAVAALLLSLIVVALTGNSAVEATEAFFDGAFGGTDALAGTASVMVPLILVGLAWIIASSARQLNLGLEGQILAGGIGASIAGANIEGLPQAVHLPIAVLAGAMGGAAWAAIPAVLHATRQVSVLLSSFLLNFVALLLVAWLIRGPLQNEAGVALLESAPVELSATWPRIGTTALTWGVLLVPLAVALLVFVQRRTTSGYRLRLISANEHAARHAGVATARIGATALIASGALAGIAGSSIILDSPTGSMTDGFSAGYGFIGIAVALLARGSAVGAIPAALLFAALEQGGGLMEVRIGVSSALVDVTQGFVVVLVAAAAWMVPRLPRSGRSAAPASPVPVREGS